MPRSRQSSRSSSSSSRRWSWRSRHARNKISSYETVLCSHEKRSVPASRSQLLYMLILGFPFPQAHRAMISSTVLQRPAPPGQPQVDIASLNINVPMPPAVPAPVAALNAGRDRDPQLVRRIRELEEEVRNLRAENEKQVRRAISLHPNGG